MSSQNKSILNKNAAFFTDVGGAYADYISVNPRNCMILNEHLDMKKFSASFINPFTALLLVKKFEEN